MTKTATPAPLAHPSEMAWIAPILSRPEGLAACGAVLPNADSNETLS